MAAVKAGLLRVWPQIASVNRGLSWILYNNHLYSVFCMEKVSVLAFSLCEKIIYLQFKGQKAYVVHGFRGSIPRLTAKQKAHGRRVWQVKVLEYMAARKQRWKEWERGGAGDTSQVTHSMIHILQQGQPLTPFFGTLIVQSLFEDHKSESLKF